MWIVELSPCIPYLCLCRLLPFSKPLLCYFPHVCWAAPSCRAYCTNTRLRFVCTVPNYGGLLCTHFPSAPSHASKCYFLGLNFPVFFFQITHTLPVEISILNQVSSKEFICIDFYTTIYLYLLVHILYYACQFYLGHCFVQF